VVGWEAQLAYLADRVSAATPLDARLPVVSMLCAPHGLVKQTASCSAGMAPQLGVSAAAACATEPVCPCIMHSCQIVLTVLSKSGCGSDATDPIV